MQDGFKQANVDGGCCVSDDTFHRRCLCDDVRDLNQCKELCAQDTGCKGYVMLERNPDYCQLATTSDCPNNCRGPYDINNIQDLDRSASCYNGQWNGGCYIRTGWSLDILCNILTHLS